MDAGLNETRMKMLGEFAEMSLVLARDLQQSALVAEDAADKVKLATAFHRLGRGLRQSLALHAKLERDAERAVYEEASHLAAAETARARKRKTQVKAAVESLIWTEAESEEADAGLRCELEDLLDIEAQDHETFLSEPLDLQIQRIAQTIGVSAPSPLAGEGVVQRTTDVGSHRDRHRDPTPPKPAQPGETPHPASFGGHLLPQGEKDESGEPSG